MVSTARIDAIPVERSHMRAALFFGALAATGASTVACEKKPMDSGTSGSPTTTAVVQPYGVPVIRDEDAAASNTPPPQPSSNPPAEAGAPRPNVVQPYGVPVMRDAGRKP